MFVKTGIMLYNKTCLLKGNYIMREVIEKTKDFKIVPEKFRSATTFDVKELKDDYFTIELKNIGDEELKDYNKGAEVEVFGLGSQGLVYFTAIIFEKDNYELKILYPDKYKDIQRREYSRVMFQGKVELQDYDAKISPIDISAGGMKFNSDKDFEIDKMYNIVIKLENTPDIKCDFSVIRSEKVDGKYIVSGKFKNLESVDRVALIQYTFKVLVQAEAKNQNIQ